jgi:hypothetical protein
MSLKTTSQKMFDSSCNKPHTLCTSLYDNGDVDDGEAVTLQATITCSTSYQGSRVLCHTEQAICQNMFLQAQDNPH